jgi:hypothetical protein
MKNEGCREAGKCSKVVPDRGDGCLFFFLCSRLLFCNVFPFPGCKAKLIGDWFENRRGAGNTITFLIIRQYYWRTDTPCANREGRPNTKKKLLAEGYIGAPIYWRTNVSCLRYRVPLHAHTTSVRKFKKRRTEQFGAPRLFSYQSPINRA